MISRPAQAYGTGNLLPQTSPCPSQSEGDAEAAAAGVGVADTAAGVADQWVDTLRNIPKTVDLGALKVFGTGTTAFTFLFSAADLRSNWKSGNWVGVGVNVIDLAAPIVALIFPPAAPVVLAYGAGRTVGDIGVLLKNSRDSSLGSCHAP